MAEKVKEFFSGKKTYIVVIGGIIYNILAKSGILPEEITEDSLVSAINTVFVLGALAFSRMGAKKAEKKAEEKP